jgi:hypothetical protein
MIVCDTWAQTCPWAPPRSSSFRCSLALATNSSHSSLRVFRHLRTAHPTKDVPPEPVEGFFSLSRSLLTPPQSFVFIQLRTLSFSGSQLSRVLPAACALFRKKPGVHPYVVYPERDAKGHLPLFFSGRACPPKLQRRRAISFISPTYRIQSRISFVSPTYAKTGGAPPPKNVGAPTFRTWHSHSWLCTRSAGNQQRTGKNACATRRQSPITIPHFCYSMERPAFLRHRSQRSANSHRKVPSP